MPIAAGRDVTRRRRLLVLALFSFLLAAPQGSAQGSTFGLRGITRRLLLRDSLIVDVDGRGVAVYDVSNPSDIRQVASAETQQESVDGTLSGGDLFVATRADLQRFALDGSGHLVLVAQFPIVVPHVSSNGRLLAAASGNEVRIFDTAARGTLPLVAAYSASGMVTALAWHGDDLLIAVQDAGVIVFNGVTLRTTGVIAENAVDLLVVGDRLYTASGRNGAAVIDIASINSPRLVGRATTGSGYVSRVAAYGNVLIAAQTPDRFAVFTLRSDREPALAAVVDEPTEAIVAGNGRLFLSGSSISSYGLESGSGVPVRIFSLAQPEAPFVAGEFHDLAGPVSGVATDGSSAFVADPPYFRVVDISHSNSAREIATLRLDEPQPYVKLLGNQVVLYGNGDAQLIDVTDPFAPRSIGTFHSGGHAPSTAAIAGTGVLEGNPFTGLHVIDFFHYASPAQTAGVKTHPFDIVADGGPVAYISRERQDLLVIALPATNDAHIAKVIPLPVTALVISPATASHPALLLARTTTAIHIFSLVDPLQPVEVASVPQISGGVFTADGDHAYIANDGSIRVVDLTNPLAPSVTDGGLRVVAPSQIAAANGKVVVADRYALRVYGPATRAPHSNVTRRRALRH